MKRISTIIWVAVCVILASIYIYPIFSGLVLLPLDLLVSNSNPWHLAGQILLKNAYMGDSVLQMFPWRHLTFTALTSGIIPLWNPYQFMGLPFMAAMKPLVFYPANIFFVFGELRAWNMLLWLQLFLSLWFTYLFVTSLGVGSIFALFAGIAFAFNSLMVSVLEFGSEGHVLLWLPILLYFVKRYMDTVKRRYIVGIAFAVACSIFAGQLQYFAYMSLVVGSFTLWYGITKKASLKTIFFPLFGTALGGLIAGIQLIPGIEMYQQSARGIVGSYLTFSNGLLRPYQLLRLLSPDWFGNPVSLDLRGGYIELSGYLGIIPLFFMLFAMLYDRKNPFVKFFTGVAVVSLLFSMNGIAQIFYALRIPIITSGYGSRLFSMFLFSGAILAGLGLQSYLKNEASSKFRSLLYYLGFVAVCFAAGVLVVRWYPSIGVAVSNIKIEVAALAGLGVTAFMYERYGKRIPLARTLFIGVVLVLTFGDLFRMGYRFLTFSNKKFLYPDIATTKFVRRDSLTSLGRVYGITEPEVNTYLGVAGIDTYNPLFPLRTAKLLQALENRSNAPSMTNKYELTQNPQMKPALDFLGVTLIVVPKGENPAITMWNSSQYEKDITKVYEADGNDIYRNATVLPRYGLFYDIRGSTTDEDGLTALRLQSLDFRKTLMISESYAAPAGEGTGSAQLVSYELNSMVFIATTNEPAVFYLSDSYDAGWHASVNGRQSPVYHANYNFRAVAVPAGKSTIRFWYLPRSLIYGGIVSALGLFLTAAFAGAAIVVQNKKVKERTSARK